MENAFIILITLFIFMFIVHLINGKMIGRYDGIRANSNCMVGFPYLASLLLFFTCRKKYNIWSCLGQIITLLYLIFTLFLQFFRSNTIIDSYKLILISFVVVHSILYLCLFIDIMIYDRKYHNRF